MLCVNPSPSLQKQVDPFMKPQPQGDLSPGPASYGVEGMDKIQALDKSLKTTLQAMTTPATTKSSQSGHFSFTETQIKYASSRSVRVVCGRVCPCLLGDARWFMIICVGRIAQKSPAAVRIGSTEKRFETGPFGKAELGRVGANNPVRCC